MPTLLTERLAALESIKKALGVAQLPAAYGFCQCGCGELAPIAQRSSPSRGHVKGEPVRFIVGHQKRLLAPRAIEVRDNGCWVWVGRTNEDGYGVIGHGRLAHRLAYEAACGSITGGLFVCHECDNPPCVNPSHLFLGTVLDNNRDRQAKGRTKSLFERGHKINQGSRSHTAKLAEADIPEIKRLLVAGVRQAEIANKFGVHSSQISRIKTGRIWSHAATA